MTLSVVTKVNVNGPYITRSMKVFTLFSLVVVVIEITPVIARIHKLT